MFSARSDPCLMEAQMATQTETDTTHIALLDFGKLGRAWRETEPGLTADQLAALIEGGQIDQPVLQVLAINSKGGTCADVTAHIASRVFAIADAEDAGFDHFTDVMRDLCAMANIDIESEQEAWEAWRANERRAWERERAALAPSISSHL